MIPTIAEGTWQSFAEEASKEMDSAKLSVIVAKLCRALENEDDKRRGMLTGENVAVALMIA